MSEYTKKRAHTNFGEIEYVTEQCVECTNEYVLDELTFAYVTHDINRGATVSESSDQLVPICLGCAEEVYGMDDPLLSQPELVEFIRAEPAYKLRLEPTVDSQEEEVMTEHGTVTVTVDQCDHCGTPVTVGDLCAVHFFIAIVDEVLQTTAPLNCPECRELYLNSPHVSSGRTVQERQIAERKQREALDQDGDMSSQLDTVAGEAASKMVNDLLVAAGCFLTAPIIGAILSGVGIPGGLAVSILVIWGLIIPYIVFTSVKTYIAEQ